MSARRGNGNISSCSGCGAVGAHKKCGMCLQARYCCTPCQKTAWNAHRSSCKKTSITRLIAAVTANDMNTVKALSKTRRVSNGKVDYFGDEGQTLESWSGLHECVRMERPEMVKVLVDAGAYIDIKDADGETPLFIAARSGNVCLVRTLLVKGANPNSEAENGWSCLMMAARGGEYETTKMLLEGGASVERGTDKFGRTAAILVKSMAEGERGLLMRNGETRLEAMQKFARISLLFEEWARR